MFLSSEDSCRMNKKSRKRLFSVVKYNKCTKTKSDTNGFKRQLWSKSEEALFIEGHRKFGNKWALLSKKIRGK